MKTVTLRILHGKFAVWKLPLASVLPPLGDALFLSVTRTAAELSIAGHLANLLKLSINIAKKDNR